MSLSKNSNNKIYALGLSGHIKAQSGKRISAGEGWSQYFTQNGIDKGALRPKALCDEFPDILLWTADPDAPGKGWISCAPANTHVAASKGPSAAAKVNNNSSQLVKTQGGGGALVTAMASVFDGINNLAVTTDSKKKEIAFSGDKETKREVVKEVVTVDPRFEVVVVTDVSGSMAGTGGREVFSAFRELLAILKPDDSVSIILFNSSIQEVLPLTKVKKVSFPSCLPGGSYSGDSFVCSGGTNLWDAMEVGMTQLARRKISDKAPSHPHLVVLTDGGDTGSSCSQTTMSEILKLPGDFAKKKLGMATGACFGNFHATCISVGSAAATNFETMGKSNLHHVKASDASKIRDCFRAVKTYIERIRVTKQVVEVKVRETVTYEDSHGTGGGDSGGGGKKYTDGGKKHTDGGKKHTTGGKEQAELCRYGKSCTRKGTGCTRLHL
jgi:Mg-chelatase subunit ChlD